MFQIGDKIVYPMNGAGEIVGVEEKNILGETHRYFVVRLSVSNMKVMLPINNIEGIGVRKIVSEDVANSAIKFFRSYVDDSTSNWNKRYRENIEKMKSGDIIRVAEVAKSLAMRESVKALSNAEKKMLTNAKNILVSELVLAKEKSGEEIENLLLCEA